MQITKHAEKQLLSRKKSQVPRNNQERSDLVSTTVNQVVKTIEKVSTTQTLFLFLFFLPEDCSCQIC